MPRSSGLGRRRTPVALCAQGWRRATLEWLGLGRGRPVRSRPIALMVSLSNHEGGAERLWPMVRQAHHEAEDLERESWSSAHNASRTDFAGDRHESYPRMVRARGEDREEAPFIPEISNTGPSPSLLPTPRKLPEFRAIRRRPETYDFAIATASPFCCMGRVIGLRQGRTCP